MRQASKDDAVGEVYEIIRDASSDETPRAIQDSETEVAVAQKRMILGLSAKGWRKNDIVAEMQEAVIKFNRVSCIILLETIRH